MKKNKKELDVDFIGGQEPLTVEEAKALQEFFQHRKQKTTKSSRPLSKQSKTIA